ncbi:DUF805 domain-containing protein [Oceanomicrobium pacificus]|uniref:DUF805 domain-containing protein n=1 Tax=Oceanomicrobium pacificus TaxID=2692916 RepID=A0A6B0TP69_9RHOB|nr:DUF805 domain-containing protein [Oceanomicrobium pacificus]MXU66357.1 DUF805 domain-containing protein [Oceanomicrobium pacificus]
MNMQESVRHVLSNYATFSGRAPRPEFWWWVLFVFVLLLVTQAIDAFLIVPLLGIEPALEGENPSRPLSMLVSLALIIPNLAVGVRRLHDTDKSGWWILIGLIPIIGFLVLLYFYAQKGTEGENRFGPPPAGTA